MNAMTNDIDSVIEASRRGHQTLLVSGRSLADLHVNERGEIRPLKQTLFRRAKDEFGMASLVFNLALGARWDWGGFSADERKEFERRLEQGDIPLVSGVRAAAEHRTPPFERAFLLLSALQRAIETSANMPPVLVLLEFGEDLVPVSDRGGSSDWVIQISELLQLLAYDYRRRMHPLLLILNGTCDQIDKRVMGAFHPVHLCQPDRDEKFKFINTLKQSPTTRSATFEEGLDDSTIANLTARTPNSSLEAAFLGSAKTGVPVSHSLLIETKRADVVTLSEGTLSLLDAERIQNTRLVGRTIERVLALLQKWAVGLKEGDPYTPMNVMLAGAPSTAKTDLALLTAMHSKTPAYAVLSPKGSLVGQTERLVRLLFLMLKELSPAFGVMDEITEAFPTERNSANLDSGASAAITAEMLNALSDSSRAGRTLLIATTNTPWKVGAAMASRFLYVPVLSAVMEDYPEILCAVAASLLPGLDWDHEDTIIRDAAMLFHRKGASPRVMRTLISSKIGTSEGVVGPALLKRAASACAPQDPRDRASAEFADLFAIRACSDLEMLPWYGRLTDYPLPTYLKGIIDETTGEPDPEALNRRIEELKPHVNV
jgi:ATPase family associated with various cellular activities (AAA)